MLVFLLRESRPKHTRNRRHEEDRSHAWLKGAGPQVASPVDFAVRMGCGSVWFLLDELAWTRCGSVAATFGLFSTTLRGRAAAWLRQHLVLARRLRADVVRLGCGSVWFLLDDFARMR